MKKLLALSILVLATLAFWAPRAEAYPTYSNDRDATNCRGCHGDFRATDYFSLADQALWGANNHNVHRSDMLNSDCGTCHGASFFPVQIGGSAGGVGFPAIGCVGCHGRQADTGNDSVSAGYGAGLRQHHTNAGETDCLNCHVDADPGFTLDGEDVLPDYYFMPDPDTAHPNKPTDSCNPAGEEDYAGSPRGLDNDGDLDYDGDDSDCTAPSPTPTPTPTPTATPTATSTPTATPTPSATATPTATATATPTATAIATPTATPTATLGCEDLWPVVEISTIGKGQSPTNNPKVRNFITGNIVDPLSLGEKASRIPVCAGSSVEINVTDTTGTPIVTENSDGIRCTGSTCVVTMIGATEKYIARSSDGKDTDRMTLLPK
jgi:hypothetical protein